MAKHSEQFKRQVVERYLTGSLGYELLGREVGAHPRSIHQWVRLYQMHGEAGLTKKVSVYSVKFKLKVLRHKWKHQLSGFETSIFFNIRNAAIVTCWERWYDAGGVKALGPRPGKIKENAHSQTRVTKPCDRQSQNSRRAPRRVELSSDGECISKKVASLKAGAADAERAAAETAQVITELRQHFPLPHLLNLAGMARSTYYYQRSVAVAGDKYAALKKHIKTIYDAQKGRYGYRRVAAQLRNAGEHVNHKVVQRLMIEMGLKSLVRPKKYRSFKGNVGEAADNLLQRNFQADGINQKWVTDVTEFKVAGQKLFLSPVMDLYNGEIIAFQTHRRPVLELVTKMLRKATRKLGKDDRPILHSDQGWHYRLPAYKLALSKKEIVQSMSRKGNCLDNAPIESFFAVLKTELFHLQKFTSIDELEKAIKKYIRYYNYERIKIKLNGLSPVQYRTQATGT